MHVKSGVHITSFVQNECRKSARNRSIGEDVNVPISDIIEFARLNIDWIENREISLLERIYEQKIMYNNVNLENFYIVNIELLVDSIILALNQHSKPFIIEILCEMVYYDSIFIQSILNYGISNQIISILKGNNTALKKVSFELINRLSLINEDVSRVLNEQNLFRTLISACTQEYDREIYVLALQTLKTTTEFFRGHLVHSIALYTGLLHSQDYLLVSFGASFLYIILMKAGSKNQCYSIKNQIPRIDDLLKRFEEIEEQHFLSILNLVLQMSTHFELSKALVEKGMIYSLINIVDSSMKYVNKILLIFSNLVYIHEYLIDECFNIGVDRIVFEIVQNGNFSEMESAARFISNVLCKGSSEQIQIIFNKEVCIFLIEFLQQDQPNMVEVVLDAINSALLVYSNINNQLILEILEDSSFNDLLLHYTMNDKPEIALQAQSIIDKIGVNHLVN